MTKETFGSKLEDHDADCSSDDEVSSVVSQIMTSVPEFGRSLSLKHAGFKINHEYLGSKKIISTNVVKESSTLKSRSDDQLGEPRIILWHRSKVILGWSDNHFHGTGMVNLGNTCYLNSSLQALFHIPSLANWLLSETSSHIKGCENNSSCVGFCSICAMMRTIQSTLNKQLHVMKPALIHNRLKCIGKTLQYGRQEDAHEFIKLLLDHMQRSYILSCRAGKLDHMSRETTPINQIFGGYLRQRVICPDCQHVSTTFSHFQDIALDIRKCGSVEDALRQYFQKETLDSDNTYKCEKCKRRVCASKRYHIEIAPNVLLLQLKRFSTSGGKINKNIAIHELINMNHFIWNGKTNGEQYNYKLVSMVNHLGGSQHSGHYTAVAKSSKGAMHEFDDNSVRHISIDNALHGNSYVLFYELVSNPNHSKIRQLGQIQVQDKNGFVNNKSQQNSAGSSVSGNAGHSPREETIKIAKNNSSEHIKDDRNKIFKIKLKSENGMLNGSRLSNPISTMDISSIGHNNVQTWDGRPSSTFETAKPGFSNKRSAHDLYNEEYDAGKLSKKKFKYEPVRRQDNPFQSYHNRNPNEDDHRSNSRYRYNKYHGNQQKRNFHSKKNFKPHNGSFGNNHHRNGYQNKSWHRGGYRGGNGGYRHNRT